MTAINRNQAGLKAQWRQAIYKGPSIYVITIMLLMLLSGTALAQSVWPGVAISRDGTPIAYEVQGSGETTLVFVHGWSCDARYWRMQVPAFANKYRVITLDLAGHGHSGAKRERYTMTAFGEDVKAVAEATGSERVILIGHSMGGTVIVEAARLMPKRVIGLIGVDTLENIEYPLTTEEFEKMVAPMKADFSSGVREFVKEMIVPATDPTLAEWILADMSSAPSEIALSATEEMMSLYITGEAAKMFKDVRVPVVSVNADLWPIDYEANRRHMASYEAIVLKGADHFLMMARPLEFNGALERAVQMIVAQ